MCLRVLWLQRIWELCAAGAATGLVRQARKRPNQRRSAFISGKVSARKLRASVFGASTSFEIGGCLALVDNRNRRGLTCLGQFATHLLNVLARPADARDFDFTRGPNQKQRWHVGQAISVRDRIPGGVIERNG